MKWQYGVLFFISAALFLMPNLLWGNLYIAGGDDGRLYYIFPLEYLKNFSLNILSNNGLGGNMGYFPVSYSAPTLLVLALFKYLFPLWNTQLLAYGMIVSLGFVFFYKFLQEWIPAKNAYMFWSGITVSLLYVLSPYVGRTYFQHQLISIFSIMVVPGCLYLFVVGVKRKSSVYVIASSLFYSLFSSTVYSLPWMLPVVFTLIPLFLYFTRGNQGYIWKALAIFVCVTLLSNMYWIIHYITPLVYQTGESLATKTFQPPEVIKQNNDTIAALTRLNSPVYQMISYLRTSWSAREGPTVFQSIGVLYIFFILLAGAVMRPVQKSLRRLFIIAVIGLLLAMLFITPSFGEWNLMLFQLLNTYVPFFGMFRNMYDKFALAMAFHYAFTLYVALSIFGKINISNIYRYIGLVLVVLVMGIRAFPYIAPAYRDADYSTRISGTFNQDFMDLTEYLKSHPTSSRYVWLPMTYPGYVFVSDAKGVNHFYSGISPLQFLAKASDMAGYYGIQTPIDPLFNGTFFELLKKGEYDAIGRILREQNIGYVIVNHEQLPQEALIFLDAYDFMTLQGEEYKKAILGEKIRNFGTRYSIYTLNKKYALPTVFSAPDIEKSSSQIVPVEFQKLQDNSYEVNLKGASHAAELVFLEPYHSLWNIYVAHAGESRRYDADHKAAYRFGNAWHIDPAAIAAKFPDMVRKSGDNAYDIDFEIRFLPERYTVPALIVSIGSMITAAVFVGKHIWEK